MKPVLVILTWLWGEHLEEEPELVTVTLAQASFSLLTPPSQPSLQPLTPLTLVHSSGCQVHLGCVPIAYRNGPFTGTWPSLQTTSFQGSLTGEPESFVNG